MKEIKSSVISAISVISVTSVLLVAATAAQEPGLPTPRRADTGTPSTVVPKALSGIAIDQRLNEPLPLDAAFRDEDGQAVTLGTYFGSKPVVLLLMYFDCPMLCSQALGGLTTALNVVSLEPGRDFEVVALSFDPADTPENARLRKSAARKTQEAGWHFLTGTPESIARVTEATGFRYTYDDTSKQFAHATAVMVATPEGRLARYLYGIEYAARDLRLALVEASQSRIGSRVDQLLLYCFHYDPSTGRYSLAILNVVRLGGILTLVALVGFVVVALRRESDHHA